MFAPEHIGKQILRDAGVQTPRGDVATSAEEAAAIAARLAVPVALKAQILSGRRGKSGGIRFAATPEEAREAARELLGATIAGQRVASVLVEERIEVARECYAAVLSDAATRGPLLLFSTAGGMDIEQAAAAFPERLVRLPVDILAGLRDDAVRPALAAAGLAGDELHAVGECLAALYGRYRALDLELIEVNPLTFDTAGRLWALDCKLVADDAARPRQPALFSRLDALAAEAGTELERRGRERGLLFIELDGDVGILANGAGLTMATMDAVAHYGGRPANFLEIGGNAYTKAREGLELVLAHPRVRSLLVNFCGAFARTDVMVEGVVEACEALRPQLPMFFSVHGTGEARAVEVLRSRLGIDPFDLMDDAVRAAVQAAAHGLRPGSGASP